MKKTLIAGLLGASLLGGAAVAGPQTTPPPAPMTKADANKDGVVTRAEAMAHAEARFAMADTDRNGQLSAEERKAMRGKHGARGAGKGGHGKMHAGMMERFDADKDGTLSPAERQAAQAARQGNRGEMRAKMLERFDTDKDGKLSPTEREAAREARKAMRGTMPTPPTN
ncbi:EF-hand domain-containing protein [Sphingomonas sp. M1-B02]|uniref:EF-hand domain-containing protein n=1 Tax=Sphingomonas sp. M1-B02 TaxID=3114300 RepID=UPI00224050ED|nr:hypothetical protein [Sphingomonas sp. S6-11]UZK66747.1 hypothetical protein OKW87_02595 [Sphingomonas sp. S6-11]